ncbi:MAG: alpha,alpha-trehalose phosphorylase [Micromonosporaceae bacterium]
MITHRYFAVDPWTVRETSLDLGVLAQSESVLALANGHIGLRANLDEGEPHGLPGTYLNSVFETRPLPYAEAGYGYPESGQTIINITNGKLIRLLVNDEPFDVRYGELHSHERTLDLRAGLLRRQTTWSSPAGSAVEVSSTRLVSFVHRSIAAIEYTVRPVDSPLQVVVQSELVANEQLPPVTDDPRAAAALEAPLAAELHGGKDTRAMLVHCTRRSRLRVGAAMDHVIDGPQETVVTSEVREDTARVTVIAQLNPGESLRIVKFLAYGWSATRSLPAVSAQVEAALTAARATGWQGLVDAQRGYLDAFWRSADVELVGDDEVQQSVRFGLFHVLQASARAERRPVPAKGLTGPGYDGHAFWDSETFVLPVLTHTLPDAAANALRWRQSTLPAALERAGQLNLRGAAFPWRSIDGRECSGYWPAGTAAFHVNADIADAVIRYVDATQDREFEQSVGMDLLVPTARLWMSLGDYDASGRFRIDGVTGPDEYSALADNNVYTNLMAQRNLYGAADAAGRHPHRARELEVTATEVSDWRAAAHAVLIPYDDALGVHPQAEGFTEHAVWDFADTPPTAYPLMLHYPYFDLYRKQVVKQADLVLALHLRGDAFTAEQKARDFTYYEPLTVRDSSLSASTQAVIAAEVGQLDLAYEYLGEASLMDLDDLQHNTRDGVHIASLAGAWTALVAGFGGMRDFGGALWFSPRLPERLRSMTFSLRWRGRILRVAATHTDATYSVLDGAAVELRHWGQVVQVPAGGEVTRPVPHPPPAAATRPRQPPGREPARRHS